MRWLVLALVAGCAIADARPGGGQSFSSGGSHSSSSYHSSGGSYHSSGGYRSSGGGGSADAGTLIAILIAGGVLVLVIYAFAAASGAAREWDSARVRPEAPPRLDLAPIVTADPDFSRVAFEDFAYQLYAAAQRARHDEQALAKLAAYVSPAARDQLRQREGKLEQVVIGTLRLLAASVDAETKQSRLIVAFEANLARRDTTLACSERWAFVRAAGAKTKPPEKTRTWPCPNCGAPWTPGATTCAHCGEDVANGRFDWSVEAIYLDAETPIGPTLTGTVAEIGNDYPTLVEDNAQLALMQMRQDDPNVTWDALTARIQMIYARLNDAWNAQDLTPVRGLVTSALLSYLKFWIDEYKRQRLANHLDDAKPQHIALAKVTRDKYYDAITVRVFADGLDYTLDREQRLVGGSRTERRAYTEYWTFLRSSARRGPITSAPSCPNCAAPLAISDAGACTHCGVEVESGSFDWVLSKIEQDDVYRG